MVHRFTASTHAALLFGALSLACSDGKGDLGAEQPQPAGGAASSGAGGSVAGATPSAGSSGASASSGDTAGGSSGGGSSGSAGSAGSAGNGGVSATAGAGGSVGGVTGMGGATSKGGASGVGGASGSGGGGASGSGGLPTVPDNGCNVRLSDTPTGYASLGGGTVGGGMVTPILVTTNEQLTTYLADSQPRVLYLMKDLDFRTAARNVQVCADDTTCDNGSGKQVDNARVSAKCDAGEHMATRTRNESRLTIKSNKTLIGIGSGSGAAIRGASLSIGASKQVILRNLRIYDVNPNLVEAGDGITLNESSHIWLDHLRIEQISDGFVDIGSADSELDDYITLSYNHINGRTAYLCGGHHNFVNFVDNGRVTYHHNFFDSGGGRNPKIGHARSNVHLYNNYWLDISYFCITAQQDGQARVESNYFENALRPHWRQLDGNGKAGIAVDDGNVYTGKSDGNTNRDVGGTVFNVPYTFSKESAAAARTSALKCSGPQPIR